MRLRFKIVQYILIHSLNVVAVKFDIQNADSGAHYDATTYS